MRREDKKAPVEKISTLEKIERIHPHLMLLYLGIFGIVLVFLFLASAFLFSIPDDFAENSGKFPFFFYLSTLVLLASSTFIHKTISAYEEEALNKINYNLTATIALGIVFCLFQFLGWNELKASGISFTGHVSGTYLYLISGLHIAHLVGGMVFLLIVFAQVKQKASDPVATLIMVTSPYEKLKLRMLQIYWHFMDALWIVLFLCFLVAF